MLKLFNDYNKTLQAFLKNWISCWEIFYIDQQSLLSKCKITRFKLI